MAHAEALAVDIGSRPAGSAEELAAADYIRAEATTRIFGFVDDLELRFDDSAQRIHIRSASRIGRSDLGANRARVERLRKAWAAEEPDR